jgi:HK97 family phage prohead protease
MSREVRTLGQVEARAAADGEPRMIVGYAAVFNSNADIAGYFVERIAPGAFSAAIGRDDVRALFNHDENLVLGRTVSGTLKLSEDATGLRYEISPPDTSWARDLVVSIERGDVSQSSFAFRATKEQWDETGDLPVRTILEAELFDVSPVTYPAYDDTEVGVRSLAAAREARREPGSRPVVSAADKLRAEVEIDLRARQISRL